MTVSSQLRYGANTTLELDIRPDSLVAHCGVPCGQPLDDVVAAVAAALVEPVDFPSIAEATVPGDRIALAIDAGVPQVANVIAGILQPLLEDKALPENITIVLAPGHTSPETIVAELPEEWANLVTVVTHDPAYQNGLAYLAAGTDGEPIYINRAICDADLVIPVGCIQVDGTLGYLGIQGGVFPAFADSKSRERFAVPLMSMAESQRKVRVREMEEAAWLLGARLTVQIVPGNGDELLHVIAGDLDSVAQQSQRLASAAWQTRVDRRADLVIAALEGGSQQQTWDNLTRSLMAAVRVVNEENGAIVICSELDEMPGPALMQMMADDFEFVDMNDELADAGSNFMAEQLADSLGRVRVYLLSRLDENVVERMGLAYVDDPREIDNLCQRHNDCILLSNAQRVWPTLEDAVSS
ncbi:MAG: lactate racemase domain-containing protein [Planctomycetota bacterium]